MVFQCNYTAMNCVCIQLLCYNWRIPRPPALRDLREVCEAERLVEQVLGQVRAQAGFRKLDALLQRLPKQPSHEPEIGLHGACDFSRTTKTDK